MKETIKVFLDMDRMEDMMIAKVDIIDFKVIFIRIFVEEVIHDIYADWGVSCRRRITYNPDDTVTIVISKASLFRKKAVENQLRSTALAICKHLEECGYRVGIF